MLTILALLYAPARAAADGTCTAWGPAERVGTIENTAADEVSGLTASRSQPGVYWAHDDSGPPVIFAVDEEGGDLGAVEVPGADVDNWEDISLGPCRERTTACACLYIGDIGAEGDTGRVEGVVWRVPEPVAGDPATTSVEAIPFRYPDGGHDAEALAVHPLEGTALVITRSDEGAAVYRFPGAPPHANDDPVTLKAVGELDLSGATDPRVTAAEYSPLGERLLVRTPTDLLVYDVDEDGLPVGLPEAVPAPSQGADEGLAVAPDGNVLVLVGEDGAVWRVACAGGDFVEAEDDDLAECTLEEEARSTCRGCGGGAAALPLLPLLLGGWSRRRRR